MRDPHVQTLHYLISSVQTISYKDPKPIHFSNHLGTFELAGGSLAVMPSEHFAEEGAAKQAIQPFLKSWEMEADLTKSIGMIKFQFDGSKIIDRNPPQPGEIPESRIVEAVMTSKGKSKAEGKGHALHSKYPDPPSAFIATPDVETAYDRWIRYTEGKEPLPAMAYFILTLLLQNADGQNRRSSASKKFQINKSILIKIGKLSTEKGGRDTARKAAATAIELTPQEKYWLEQATRTLIHRMGEYESGQDLQRITPSDLLPR